ncbi:MAG TPA: hypothetical protein PLL78_01040 [Fimbriimonadaceae bacterium]|nr:hypothetical protein [Fimbriimonadaceae bacterium]HRJ95247.1 hypothetical protein [Fimbriimonadaceae bacterium]
MTLRALLFLSAFASAVAFGEDLVRTGELAVTIQRTDTIFRTVLKLPAPSPPTKPKDEVASRLQILEGFWRLYSTAKPKFVFTLTPVKFDAKRLSSVFKGVARERLVTLIQGGFVAPYGPLATGTRSVLTLEEYGDALGHLIARAMERTHTPSRQYSPYLQGFG